MDGARGSAAARQDAANVKQATGIAGGDELRSGLLDVLRLAAAKGGGDFGHLHGKGAAEATAFFRLGHFEQFQAADGAQQLARLVAHAKLAQEMTGVVEDDAAREVGADVGNAKAANQKLGELEDAALERFDVAAQGSVGGGEQGEETAHHGGAGTGRTDDGFGGSEDAGEAARQGAGFLPVSGAEGRLTAAGLRGGKVHGAADALKHPHYGLADGGGELIDETRNK